MNIFNKFLNTSDKPAEQGQEKILARVNSYEIFSPHKDVFILRDESTKLVIRHGKFTAKFQLTDLLKQVEKLAPIKLKRGLTLREVTDVEKQETTP